MLTHELYLLLLTGLTTTRLTSAIRVDWGTNEGPIVPPTPSTTIKPQPPYREPAPVWENQRNDIPNPNPYIYVLPPPSRPRTWPISSMKPDNYNGHKQNNSYGSIITQPIAGNKQIVAALAPQYLPNIGYKYVAVVPNKSEHINIGYYLGIGNKQQGKYNAKTKKYKVYEKAKYAPQNYLVNIEQDTLYLPSINIDHQELPLFDSAPIFNDALKPTQSTNITDTATTITVATTKKTSEKKISAEKSQIDEKKANLRKPQQHSDNALLNTS